MRYIQSFQNDAAIQAAVDDGSLGHPYIALDDQTGKIDWDGKDSGPATKYLTIEVFESGDFKVYCPESTVDYSLNGGNWTVLKISVAVNNISVSAGDKIRFRHSGESVNFSMFQSNTISFSVYGNIESLEYGDDFVGKTEILKSDNAFSRLFKGSTGLVSAENLVLPATTMKPNCYGGSSNFDGMFSGCTSLTTAPALPATTLASGCYANMFWNCTSLTKAPELLYSGDLPSNAYYSMFRNCDSLTYVKCLATPSNSANFWLGDINSTGTLAKKSGTNWRKYTTSRKYGIPAGWTEINA